MQWEQIVSWFDVTFNKPLPVVGVSLTVIIITAFRLFAKSSFGKKQIRKAEAKAEEVKANFETKKKEFEDKINEYKEECDKKISAIQEFYETSLAQYQASLDASNELLMCLAENSHNEVVKQKVIEYKTKLASQQTIMTQKINEVRFEYEKKVKELEDMFNEIKERIDSDTTKEEI